MTEEHKKAIQEGRIRAKQNKQINSTKKVITKPNCYLSGKELNAFDFINPLRNALRPVHQYTLLHQLEKQITAISIWENIEAINIIIFEYVTICIIDNNTIKPEKKKREYIMTEEHKQKLLDSRKKKEKVE